MRDGIHFIPVTNIAALQIVAEAFSARQKAARLPTGLPGTCGAPSR